MNGLRSLLVVCLLTMSFANVIMSSAGSVGPSVTTGNYQSGVRVGEWWQSNIEFCSTRCLPPFYQFALQNSTVAAVSGNNVTLQNDVTLPNRTVVKTTIIQNIATGQPGIPYYLTAANLTTGQPVYNSTGSLSITGTGTSIVLGAERNVTRVLRFVPDGNFSIGVFETWDRLTGIMISGFIPFYGVNATLTLTATNAWSPTPDFSLSLFPYNLIMPSNGTQYLVEIMINSLYGFNGELTLSTVSNSTDIVATLGSSLVNVSSPVSYDNVTVSSHTVGDYSVNVTATSGSLSHSATIQAIVRTPTKGSFTLTASQDSVTMLPGNSTIVNISVTSVDNFTGPIYLNVVGGLNDPFAPQAFINPTQLTIGMNQTENTVLTIETPNFPESGRSTIEVDAVGGLPTLYRNFNISLTVLNPDFVLTASPSEIVMSPGGVASSTITVRDYGLFGTLRLAADVYPTGLNCVLSVVNISMPPGPNGVGNSTLTCLGSPGVYNVTIVTMGYQISHSITVKILSDDFTMTASPGTLSMSSGASGNATVTIKSYGLSGIVDVSLSVSSASVDCLLNQSKVLVGTSFPTGNVTLSCHGSPGTYTVTITGTSGRLSHSSTVSVTIASVGAKPSTSSGFSLFGLPMIESYGAIAGIIAVALVLAGIGVYWARRRPAAEQGLILR